MIKCNFTYILKTDLLNTNIDSPKASIGFINILLIISTNISVMAIEYLGSKKVVFFLPFALI